MTGEKHPGKKVVGYGWTGLYRGRSEHRLGWLMPHFVVHNQSSSLTQDQLKALGKIPNRQFANADMWRVKITLEPVNDKNGKFIVRRFKKRGRTRSSGKDEQKGGGN